MAWTITAHYTDGTSGKHPTPYTTRKSARAAARRLEKTGGIRSTSLKEIS